MAQYQCTVNLYDYFGYEDLYKLYDYCLSVIEQGEENNVYLDGIDISYDDKVKDLYMKVENSLEDLLVTYYDDRKEDVHSALEDWVNNIVLPYIEDYYNNFELTPFTVLSVSPLTEISGTNATSIKDIKTIKDIQSGDYEQTYSCIFTFDTEADVTDEDLEEIINDIDTETEELHSLVKGYELEYGVDTSTIRLSTI